jgi:hypothetical protein
MSQQAVKKFKEIKDLFKRLSDEMCLVVESYYIWRSLTFTISILEVGEEKANRNVQILTRYNDFFTATKYSHFQTFVMGLYKFFDTRGDSLNLDRLIKEIDKYQYAFKPEIVRIALPELGERGLVPDDYKPIDNEILNKIESIKSKHEKILTTLEDLRHSMAHIALNKIGTQRNFIPAEVEEFISAIQEMFNILSGKFDLSFTHWDHLQDVATQTTNYLLDDLERAEKNRWKNGRAE